ncbi:hypothetical protein DPMN_055299 [Dreissena polymorpha]|uniref:Uncharacterized protein n=1 Tax=Dreissena polymorpha TaxID=45954 RepID=A0A9D4CR51_DREPO|nr:hypothetical protein DPMN_055299 [Dreissena polymorpha]
MGPCIVEIDQVNRCRNEDVIVKCNFGWVWPTWAGRPRIDRIVIREVQYQLVVNRLKGNFGWVWPMWAGRPRIDRIVIREVQYQFKVNLCRNEEIIVKGNFGWVWSKWAGRPRVGNGAMHKVQYQFEVNWCRNEEVNKYYKLTNHLTIVIRKQRSPVENGHFGHFLCLTAVLRLYYKIN